MISCAGDAQGEEYLHSPIYARRPARLHPTV